MRTSPKPVRLTRRELRDIVVKEARNTRRVTEMRPFVQRDVQMALAGLSLAIDGAITKHLDEFFNSEDINIGPHAYREIAEYAADEAVQIVRTELESLVDHEAH